MDELCAGTGVELERPLMKALEAAEESCSAWRLRVAGLGKEFQRMEGGSVNGVVKGDGSMGL